VFFDAATNSGAYQGNVVFDTGACLDALHATRAEGFTFGGILTPAAGTVPAGYSMQVDGFVEAQKQVTGCEIHCFGIETARFDFPRMPKHVFKPTDGKFRIKGEFVGCPDTPRIDPTQIEIRVQIGGPRVGRGEPRVAHVVHRQAVDACVPDVRSREHAAPRSRDRRRLRRRGREDRREDRQAEGRYARTGHGPCIGSDPLPP